MKKLILPLLFLLLLSSPNLFSQPITIAEAIEDLNMDLSPDRLDDTVTVAGVVISPNLQTTNSSFYIYDWTAGTDIFLSGTVLTWALGDSVEVTGTVAQFNGMTEIIPLDATSWDSISSGNPVPDPEVITLAVYKANPEMYEGTLVGFIGLTKVSGNWPASGSSANLSLTDGVDTVVFRIDSDTDIDGQTEPAWPMDVIGIGAQFDNSTPYDGGYQIFPRYYATDFLPTGTLPVELSTFTAVAQKNGVTLHWTTASELNNSGFEVERSRDRKGWSKVAFIQGNGTTSSEKKYSYYDENLTDGKYQYRLKQIDFDGSFEYSKIVEIQIGAPAEFELSQNYPNPFNPSTKISFTIPKAGHVSLKIYNTLGQEVADLVNGVIEAGIHNIQFEAVNLNSGIYFYRLEAENLLQVRKMTLIK
jgi:Secretion system C-terminal sorting domain